ncbi:MAG: protein-glutamate methylesterase (protein methylesterase)-like protein, partial [Variovorax sp.]|nr:protein-glutamate methylesterase (protein methylesterase)-like protein [Variovorax sp.]
MVDATKRAFPLTPKGPTSLESATLAVAPQQPVPGLVVIGASAGGVHALMTLVSGLPTAFPWAILVVLHVGNHHSVLPGLLASSGPLPAAHAQNEERILPGRIYVAPPDRHLIVEDGHIQVTKGPKEHFTRPAIDPLFLSAALAYGTSVVGVVLTGTLEDGTAGLQAIKACGGMAVVQDPEDAQEPGMPRSALRYVAVDHCGPVAELAETLVKLTSSAPVPGAACRPEHLAHEDALARAQGDPVEHLAAIARPSTFVCPDCKGALWQYKEGQPIRFRCHTGHAYPLKTLQLALAETADMSIWSAVRALQGQGVLLG